MANKLTSTKMEFVWENPPNKRVSKYDKVVKELIKNPSKWALIGKAKTTGGLQTAINNVAISQNTNGVIEITGRRLPDYTFEVYARWVAKKENK